MTVRTEQGRVILEGRCRVEDAEALLVELQRRPSCVVDIARAEALHTAVVQVLLAAKVKIEGPPRSEFLAKFAILAR